jgi:hypothetical protein
MQREALAVSCPLLSCAHSHGNLGLSFPTTVQDWLSCDWLVLFCSLYSSQAFPQAPSGPSNATLPLYLDYLLQGSLCCGQDGAYCTLLRAPVEALAFRGHRITLCCQGVLSKCRCKLRSFHPLSQLFTQESIFDAK